MNKIGFLILLCGTEMSFASGAVCQKCERIREENVQKAATEKQYEFYEDWLEDHHNVRDPAAQPAETEKPKE